MPRTVISPKTATRAPHYPYRGNPRWPHEVTDGPGELIMDALSGFWFPKVFAVEGPYGLVDGRNGAVVDTDVGEHQMVVTMKGPQRPPRT